MVTKRLLPALLAASLSAAAEDPVSVLHQLDAGFVQVFEKIAPAVVVIEATKPDDEEDADARTLDFFLKEGEDPQNGVPLPRGPVKRIAWGIRPERMAFRRARVTWPWPETSSKLCGRHLRAMTW